MRPSIPDIPKSRGRPKTTGRGTAIVVRCHDEQLAPLDAWIADQPEPRPSRPEAIRNALTDWLTGHGYVRHRNGPEGQPSRAEEGSIGMPKLTRQEAVAELVDGAIGAWFDGRHACAITLAGAAETGMPKIDGRSSAFHSVRDVVMKFGKCSEKEAVKIINGSRDWLKHFDVEKPDTISTDFAWAYVLRAYMQFLIVYGNTEPTANMARMRDRIDRELEPLRTFAISLMAAFQQVGNAILPKPSHTSGSVLPRKN